MSAGGNLIVVACHAVFVAGRAVCAYPDEAAFYLEHAERGVALAAADEGALLLFSGGATQAAAGRRSEGESYLDEARRHAWWGYGGGGVEARAASEDYARDSRENVLFALCRFRELRGGLPERVTAVGWKFKAERFALHAASLGWPAERFAYVGVNDPPGLERALRSEAALVEAVRRDPRMEGVAFAAKRAARDPFGRGCPYDCDGVEGVRGCSD